MVQHEDSEEIKDLIKKKTKLMKDPHKLDELGDIIFQIGYYYYQKAYYKEALEEFEHCLEVRKKLSVNLDIATTHRFIGETLCKLGYDFERAKLELNFYYSITLKINDYVEIQRSHTTLGNYYMTLAESNYKNKRVEHLNEAYSHYLKSYELLNEIADRRLVDNKEFGLMKARTCLNCAFVTDEKRDLIICNEYLKTAISICEEHHFYEDLIRCLYIKCDQAKRKNKMEETLKVADRIIDITQKTKDYVQQSSDFVFVAEIYIKVQNFEKAKMLLRKAYKLRKKCLIGRDVVKKLKEVMNVIELEKEVNQHIMELNESKENASGDDKTGKLYSVYEKLGDSYCNLSLFEMGLNSYFKQLNMTKQLNKTNAEIAIIYSSIGQTYQDLEDYENALKYFQLELKFSQPSEESECKTLLNMAVLKEKLQAEFDELKKIYTKAYEKAERINNSTLRLKVLKQLRETELAYGHSKEEETVNRIRTLKLTSSQAQTDDDEEDDGEGDDDDEDDIESLIFSSDSEDDGFGGCAYNEEEKCTDEKFLRSKNTNKKMTVKRNLRGETPLHVACIKGNFKLAKKLIEEGHPINERDNLNWLPIHEACNYGHVELVDLLIKNGAKINDLIGPITPLHDASQNGHFEVVQLLLKGGAFSYVFTKEGYTPLDFLCKYKEDNKDKMSQSEMELFQELYNEMLTSIRNKDRMYKIKKVIYPDDEIVAEDDDTNESRPAAPKPRNDELYEEDSSSDSKSTSSSNKQEKKNKKKAIVDYKQAMTNIGSKASSSISCFNKAKVDKVIISESDYKTTDDWLIDDMRKTAEKTKTNAASSTNKRKYSFDKSDENTSDDETNNRKYSTKSKSVDFDVSDESSGSSNDRVRPSSIEITSKRNKTNLSKKRLLDTDFDSNSNTSSNNFENSDLFQTENTITNENKLKDVRKNIELYDYIEMVSDDGKKSTHNNVINENDLIEISPLKTNNNQAKTVYKKQLKLTNIVNYNVKKTNSTTTNSRDVMVESNDEVKKLAAKPMEKDDNKSMSDSHLNKMMPEKVMWKIKAVIDNRNFLIPVANINGTIDDLIVQILSRYKTIFSNDASYREPTKCILKSSDDLILFGQDLIKDVLVDSCQVHVLVEAYKEAPKLEEIYEQQCKSNDSNVYSNVKESMKLSETTFNLELAEILFEHREICKHFDIIFNTIRTFSRQSCSGGSGMAYVGSLIKVDLSSNYLTDQTMISFVDSSLCKCANLKVLNLSNNLISLKSVKLLIDLGKQHLTNVEYLNLAGNELGEENAQETLTIFNSLFETFVNLIEVDLSDCKLDFLSFTNVQTETQFKRLVERIKNSNVLNVNLSFNKIGEKCKMYINELNDSMEIAKIKT